MLAIKYNSVTFGFGKLKMVKQLSFGSLGTLKTRFEDGYVDGTQLSKIIDCKIGSWRRHPKFQTRLSELTKTLGMDETQLFITRKKHHTFLHPSLAYDFVMQSKSQYKQTICNWLLSEEEDNFDNCEELSEEECDDIGECHEVVEQSKFY